MRIARVDLAPLSLRFRGGGYSMSAGTFETIRHRLLRVELEDGLAGFGEVARRPVEPPADDLEDASLPRKGKLADLPAEAARLREADPRLHALAFALDTAFHDLVGRRAGVPVASLLGGPATGTVPEIPSLSCAAPERMAAEIRGLQGLGTVQAKLGHGGDPDLDLRRVGAMLAELAPGQTLLADFNGALPREAALELLPAIEDSRLVCEEPCATYEDNLAVARAVAAPVLFDQCLTGRAGFLAAIRDRAAWGVVIRPAGLGSLAIARAQRDLAAAAGIRVRIDGPWSGQVAAAAVLHLALGIPPELQIGCIDCTAALETPRQMIARGDGRVGPAPGPGLGPAPEGIFPEPAR